MLYAGILAPFLITYTFNLIIYFIIMGSLGFRVTQNVTTSAPSNKQMMRRDYKRLCVVAFFLAVMFGLAWIFALLVALPNTALSLSSQYIFSFFIASQGLLYFVMHVVRSPEARKFWLSLFCHLCPGTWQASIKTWTTTSPQHVTNTSKPANLKTNPIYTSQDNLFASPGESACNTLQRDTTDLATSPSSYSLASQTLQIDFTLPTIVSDDDSSASDLEELAHIISTKFSDPGSPGVAVSSPQLLVKGAHEDVGHNSSHLTAPHQEKKEKEETGKRRRNLPITD